MKKVNPRLIPVIVTLVVLMTMQMVWAAPITPITAPGISAPLRDNGNKILKMKVPVEEWEKIFGIMDSNDFGISVQQTTDGGYIITGYTSLREPQDVNYGNGWTTEPSKPDIYLVKTGANGNKQWEKTFGGAKSDEGHFVQQTTDGGYIIIGSTNSTGAGGMDVYMIKTGAGGSKQWERTFGGAKSDEGYSVRQTIDGGYIIAGATASSGAGNNDVYLVKTDASGNTQWEKSFGGVLTDEGYSVQQTSDGGYIIAGKAALLGSPDLYLIKIKMEDYKPSVPTPLTISNITSTPGAPAVEWEKTFKHSSGNDYGNSVQQTPDGGYIITGYTTPSLDSWYSMDHGVPELVSPDSNVYLVKTSADGSNI